MRKFFKGFEERFDEGFLRKGHEHWRVWLVAGMGSLLDCQGPGCQRDFGFITAKLRQIRVALRQEQNFVSA